MSKRHYFNSKENQKRNKSNNQKRTAKYIKAEQEYIRLIMQDEIRKLSELNKLTELLVAKL